MVGVVTSGRIRENLHFGREMIKERFGLAVERNAVDGHCYHFRARGLVSGPHLIERTIFARADDQA